MATKRVAIISDLHCGHRAGLTPPQWRFRECSTEHVWKKFTAVQREAWGAYEADAKGLAPVDCVIVNGDLIDGRGEKSGGVELITGDRNEQCKIACDCVKVWRPKKIVITRGTPYHTGDIESWEDLVAEMLKGDGYDVKIGDHEWVDVNGFVLDCKHHIGGSQTPYGRATALSRDETWNSLWAEAGLQPRASMVVRSHVHYHVGGWRYVGGRQIWFLTTPALQAMGTRYGARRCSGLVDFGSITLDIDKQGRIVTWHNRIKVLRSTMATALPV